MLCTGTTALKRVLNVFVPIHCASISSFQDLDDEREKNNSRDYLREAQPPKVQIVSAATIGDKHSSYLKSHDIMISSPSLSIYDHSSPYGTVHAITPDDGDSEGEEDNGSSSATNPIIFSEDPIARSNEMLELANDLVDIALTNIAESEEIMDASLVEDLSRWKERLDQTSDMLEMLETDTPAERLVKAWTYLMAAGEFLKRVIFVVELAKSLDEPEAARASS